MLIRLVSEVIDADRAASSRKALMDGMLSAREPFCSAGGCL